MESCLARAKEILAQPAVEATWELVLKAVHSVARRPIAENRPDSVKRLAGLDAPAWRLDRLGRAFAVPGRQRSIPSPARLGSERCPCSYGSSRKCSEPLPPPRVKFSDSPCVFLPGFVRNRFHAARDQSQRARSHRKARKEARSQTMWTTAPASEQPDEEIQAISVNQVQRFNQARIAYWKKRTPRQKSQINETEGRADGDERNQIPDARMHATAM